MPETAASCTWTLGIACFPAPQLHRGAWLNGNRQATVELGEEQITVRHGERGSI